MDLLDKKFEEIINYIKSPQAGGPHGDKDICYLTFDPSQILEVKRKTSSWVSIASHHDLTISQLSLARILNDFFLEHPNRENWKQFETTNEKWEMEEFFQDLGFDLVARFVVDVDLRVPHAQGVDRSGVQMGEVHAEVNPLQMSRQIRSQPLLEKLRVLDHPKDLWVIIVCKGEGILIGTFPSRLPVQDGLPFLAQPLLLRVFCL